MYYTKQELIDIVKKMDYTTAQIAEKMDVTYSSVWQMVRGDSNMEGLLIRFLELEGYDIEGGYYKVNSA